MQTILDKLLSEIIITTKDTKRVSQIANSILLSDMRYAICAKLFVPFVIEIKLNCNGDPMWEYLSQCASDAGCIYNGG